MLNTVFSSALNAVNRTVHNFFAVRFERFLQKRLPARSKQTLNNHNIFIFPSRFGFVYLAFVLLLFLLGTNYQNNIILILSFLLASFFITAMLHSFFNVAKLTVSASSQITGFCQQPIDVALTMSSNKSRFDLQLNFPDQVARHFDVFHTGENKVTLHYVCQQRGYWPVGRLKLISYYGFGLFRTWAQVDLALYATVYPKPISFDLSLMDAQFNHQDSEVMNNENRSYQAGIDDFYELGKYQKGQPLSHVAWKQVAKGQGWYAKKYQAETSAELCLSLTMMPGTHLEEKLSYLTFAILEYYRLGYAFSLKLPDKVIAAANNEQHLRSCLTALAYYGMKKPADFVAG